ncbi:ABC transporter substrate-binding protein [Paenibacillus oleatilyticus]|uniref:ABC transporter substrate-binding protein n=1 Tax=Paenibacillus oleatilyticus TaxID=2594886 RepID=UPI001C200C7F|nr:ABC transporter substrate-binding protein [Paenibacillus oleatilyticus]MBU7314494.1 ABC transporter substrate-binding protein [Paenibacillus oleatilyticus]
MKKKLAAVLNVCAAVGLLAGCAASTTPAATAPEKKEESPKKESVSLNAIFMKQAGYSEEAIKEAVDAFIKANPNIKVEATFVPYEALEQKILVGGGSYDVMLIDAPWTAKFVKANLLLDVTGKVSDAERGDIFEGALSAMRADGKLYGMPWLNDVKYLFYNKEMLEKAGIAEVPKTWDELIAASKTLKEKKIVEHPIVWSWKQAEALSVDFTMIAGSFGGEFVKDGKPTIRTPENVEALTFMQKSIKDGLTNPSSVEYLEEDVRGVFSSGKAAFALNWTYMYDMANDPKESKVVGKVGIAAVPGTAKKPSATTNGGMGLAISKKSKHSDEAWKFIQFLSSKEFQKKHAQSALPIWKSLFNDSAVVGTNPQLIEVSKKQYEHIVNRAQVPWYGQFSTELQVSVHQALLDKATPQKALDDLQAKVVKDIAK